jgi:hypothetical protein
MRDAETAAIGGACIGDDILAHSPDSDPPRAEGIPNLIDPMCPTGKLLWRRNGLFNCVALVTHKGGRAFDVEMSAPGAPPRTINCFNSEADAWQWLNQQREVDRFARRLKRDPNGHGRV